MRTEVKVFPAGFLERLRKILPPGKFDSAANTFAEKVPTTFRVNPLKTSINIIKGKIESHGFRLEPVSWYSGAFILKQGTLRELQQTSEYKNGEIYVQSLSSMLPPLVLDPKHGEIVLDLAAAPGSKTTQMAAMTEGKGKIIACDNNRIRFYKLKANLEMQGAANVEAMLCYGESIRKKFPNYFDKVLLDAPCSSEGRFQANEPASFGYWKLRKVYEMAKKQKKLIASAIQALKPGGTLVYSTCTFAPEENEAVLNWTVQKFGDAIEVGAIHPSTLLGTLSLSKGELPLRMKNKLITTDYIFGNLSYKKHWTEKSLLTLLRNLPEGTSEIMCHPGFADQELRSKSSFVIEREREFKLFSQPAWRVLINKEGVDLVNTLK